MDGLYGASPQDFCRGFVKNPSDIDKCLKYPTPSLCQKHICGCDSYDKNLQKCVKQHWEPPFPLLNPTDQDGCCRACRELPGPEPTMEGYAYRATGKKPWYQQTWYYYMVGGIFVAMVIAIVILAIMLYRCKRRRL